MKIVLIFRNITKLVRDGRTVTDGGRHSSPCVKTRYDRHPRLNTAVPGLQHLSIRPHSRTHCTCILSVITLQYPRISFGKSKRGQNSMGHVSEK